MLEIRQAGRAISSSGLVAGRIRARVVVGAMDQASANIQGLAAWFE
ncbi:hypothetical protein [Rhodanobacter sp. A1T4]|nr:hypothetical protein [Rhodanobacter sp. A1T4]MBB6245828.1 hypothetical protein [Rhodanobacter sp. A1T4]